MDASAKRKYAASLSPEMREKLMELLFTSKEPNRFVDWAVDQLVNGKDSPNLRILAGLAGAEVANSQDYFRKALLESGFSIPDEGECRIFFCADVARKMLTNRLAPFEGCAKLTNLGHANVRVLDLIRDFSMWDDDDWAATTEEKQCQILKMCDHFVARVEGYVDSGVFRIGFEQSLKMLAAEGWEVPATASLIPPRMPALHGDAAGLSFFRTQIDGCSFGDFTLPRTCFLRSRIDASDFRNADIHESLMTWCDWDSCTFTQCDLSRCDLRRSIFKNCCFTTAVLDGADLRGVSFQGCDFGRASMKGAKLSKAFGLFSSIQAKRLKLSEEQRAEIEWVSSIGDAPDGG